MFNVTDFLVKFKNIKPPNDTIREYISNLIYTMLNIKIEKSNIKINNNSIYIKANHFIKNEIFINKEKILNDVNTKFIDNNIKNII